MIVSRRRIIPLLAAAASAPAVLVSNAAWAQANVWREYRRDDLGFRVELPGEPEVEEKEDEAKDILIRSVDVQVDYEKMSFGVHHTEYKDTISAEEEFGLFREGMAAGGFPVTREAALMIEGVSAREFICESDAINLIHQLVVRDRFTIGVAVAGESEIHGSPLTRRFFDSFKLLGNAR